MRNLFAALAAIPLLAVASIASAQEPLVLSNGQMDMVTAGSASGVTVLLTAIATGAGVAATQTAALAQITQTPVVIVTPFGPVTLSAGTTLVTAVSASAN